MQIPLNFIECGSKINIEKKGGRRTMARKKYIIILSLLLAASAVFTLFPRFKQTNLGKGVLSSIGLNIIELPETSGESSKSEAPETEAPETEAPETEAPETEAPETEAPETEAPETEAPETEVPETEAPETEAPETEAPETEAPETEAPETEAPETEAPETEAPETEAPETEAPAEKEPMVLDPLDPSEFDNSLFIGDSRTMGLLYYGKLGEADVFATHGMTVFRAFTQEIEVKSAGLTTLEPLLQSKSYDRVYIMLGINEIGSSIEGIMPKYTELVSRIRETQPEATIYVCANLHIAYSKSSVDSVYNNTRLNAINEFASTLADGEKIKYLDINEYFDDENGCLPEEYTTDGFHPGPPQYRTWVQWLCTVC